MDVLDSLIDNLDEALFILDQEGKILLYNEVAVEMNRSLVTKPFHVGDNLIDSMGLEKGLFIRDAIHEIKLTKEPEKSFIEFTNKYGVKVPLEFNFVPVINKEGVETHIHLFIRDLSVQKIFEKKMSAQAADLTSLIDNANAIIIGVDASGYITVWNKQCSEITGFEKEEAYTQKLSDLLINEATKRSDLLNGLQGPSLNELIKRGLNHESINNSLITIHNKEGKQRIFLLNGTPKITAAGEVVGLVFVGHDVTELYEYRKSLERKVEERTRELNQSLKKEKEAVEVKNRFVSIASHEFRLPISSIEFQTGFIKKTKKIDREKLYKSLEIIEKQVNHMKRLLDDVLVYGKNEAGKIQLVMASIPLLEFLKGITEEVSHRKNNHHKIEESFNQIPEVLRTDEKLLRGILTNLLTNAIKFSPDKKRVYLNVNGNDGQIVIEVRDEGIGIPAEELTKIFEPFHRGNAVANIQGTGLGLSIVKKSVEILSGSIQVESIVNQGTVFRVTIPIQS